MNNKNENIEMLDAINSDEPHEFETTNGHEVMMDKEGISFVPKLDYTFEVTDPQTARRIAGALVAWANKREDFDMTSTEMAAAMRLFSWTEIASKNDPINASRTNWYVRSVKLMTFETMARNFDDLKRIEKAHTSTDGDLADIRRSMDFLWVAMREKNPNLKQCQRCQLVEGSFHSNFCKGR